MSQCCLACGIFFFCYRTVSLLFSLMSQIFKLHPFLIYERAITLCKIFIALFMKTKTNSYNLGCWCLGFSSLEYSLFCLFPKVCGFNLIHYLDFTIITIHLFFILDMRNYSSSVKDMFFIKIKNIYINMLCFFMYKQK